MLTLLAALAVPSLPAELDVTAAAGRPTIAAAPPGFCQPGFEPLRELDASVSKLERLFRLEYTKTDDPGRFKPFDEIVDDGQHVARLACTWPDDTEAQRWRAAYEQKLVNALGLTRQDLDQIWSYTLTRDEDAIEADASRAMKDCPFQPSSQRPDERDRDRGLQRWVCEYGNRWEKHWDGQAWFADRGQSLSILEKTALVSRFVGDEAKQIGHDLDGNGSATAMWIFIREDALSLDAESHRKALDALDLTPYMQLVTTIGWAELQLAIARTNDDFDALANRDSNLAALLTAGEDARESWRKTMADNAEAFGAAKEIERAWLGHPDATMEGCRQSLRAHFAARAKALGMTKPDDVHALVHDDLGFWLLSAWRRCEAEMGDPVNAAGLGTYFADAGMVRGPRTAAVLAAMREAAAMQQTGRAPFRAATMIPWAGMRSNKGAIGRIEQAIDWSENLPRGLHGLAHGVLATVRPNGDKLDLTFQTARWEAPVWDCVETDQILTVRDDGTLVFRSDCTQTGTEWLERTEAPLSVDLAFNKGLKPGMYVRADRFGESATSGEPRRRSRGGPPASESRSGLSGGFVHGAFSDPSQQKVHMFTGIW